METKSIGIDSLSQITDRLSMRLFFTKVYTTRSRRPMLKALIFISKISPEKLEFITERRDDLKSFSIKLIRLEPYLYRVHLNRTINESKYSGVFLLDTSQNETWIALTNADTYYVNHILKSFFKKLYPHVSSIYFNFNQMKIILNIIKDEYKGLTTFTNFTIRRVKKSGRLPTVNMRIKGTLTLWEKNADEEIMRLIKDYFVTINRLNFDIKDKYGMLLLRANITRDGKCSLHYGDFNNFYNKVIFKIIDYGLNWKNFYDKREISLIEKNVALSPFSIIYDEILSEQDILKLSEKITTIYSCSIIYGGNPYFVANIRDYEEGSSFGVTVLGKIITITPITKGTPEAIWRLTENIQNIVGDGVIQNVTI